MISPINRIATKSIGNQKLAVSVAKTRLSSRRRS